MEGYVIALDQGTTSSRAIIFDRAGDIVSQAQYPFEQHYPKPGWVEHDPMDIIRTQFHALGAAFERSGLAGADIAGIGITNQRETALVWDGRTGEPVCNAIVWQCRRTAPMIKQMVADGMTDQIRRTTGLVPDPYFSGTKIRWILDNVPGAREKAEQGKLLFGTVDTWLIWNLTGRHVTDPSNASRTMLFDINRLCWDEDMCRALDIPMSMLPEVLPNSGEFGRIRRGIPGLEQLEGIPICGAAGDQQAALLGQGCLLPGQAKNTYGTGCFTLMNVGGNPPRSENGLLTSVGWQVNGKTCYAVEGSVFNAGSSIQWLRDEMGLISTAHECDVLAETVADAGGLYMVSAFTGLGAPWWDPYARGAVLGVTRGTTRAHLCRAVLEGIAYQVADLLELMEADTGRKMDVLRVDGGASVSDLLMQFQADLLQRPIDRPETVETTALGAAFLAGLSAGVWTDMEDVRALRRTQRRFEPVMRPKTATRLMDGWHKAVERARDWAAE